MAWNNIISRLGTRFSNGVNTGANSRSAPDVLTRDIGGQWRNNHPYISGYFQVMFGLPLMLFPDDYAKNAARWLHSTCEGFTPHTQNITKVDIQGQGQIGSSYVANVITTREITLTFREYQNMPIMNIIRTWSSIFDPFTGTSPLPGNQFLPSNYKGWCAVMQTKPVRSDKDSNGYSIEDIEECYIYQGVFPTTIPIDTASAADITANDTVQLSVTFSFDGSPMTSAEPGISDAVVNLFNNMSSLNSSSTTVDSMPATFTLHQYNAIQSATQFGTVPTFTTNTKAYNNK